MNAPLGGSARSSDQELTGAEAAMNTGQREDASSSPTAAVTAPDAVDPDAVDPDAVDPDAVDPDAVDATEAAGTGESAAGTVMTDGGPVQTFETTLGNGDPARVCLPTAPGAHPLALFLQGANVEYTFYTGFCQELAGHGLVVVIPNHDNETLGGLFAEASQLDVVHDWAQTASILPGSLLEGRVDASRMIVMGHSFGGVQAANALAPLGRHPAVVAGALFGTSNSVSGLDFGFDNGGLPVMFVNGDLDSANTPEETQGSYDDAGWPKAYATLRGSNHYGLCDENNPTGAMEESNAPTLDQQTSILTTARWFGRFLRAFVSSDEIARGQICSGNSDDPNVTLQSKCGTPPGAVATDLDPSAPLAERLQAAEALNETWCEMTQRRLAHLQGTAMASDMNNTHHTEIDPFVESKAAFDTEASPMLEVHSYTLAHEGSLPPGVDRLSEQVFCKTRSAEFISANSSLALPGHDSCASMNQAALDWALAQLDPDEYARYQRDGAALEIGEDLIFATGSEWSSTASVWTELEANRYQFQSSVLYSDPLIGSGLLGLDTIFGVLYCKLLSPAQALLWVSHRGFEERPL